MKKITYLFFLMGTFSWVNAQVLNQNAGWPNPAWTVTGTYNTDPLAYEADPTTTANFAFDDDDAGISHEDNIAAESPVIDLTPAYTAGETWLSVTVQYGYRYLANDRLRFEYWDAAAAAWVAWGSNIPGNDTSVTDNFCTITKTAYTTSVLNIASFSATQLSGFKYRISYDDDPAGIDWNWGFCFDSPTIVSATPPSCPSPTALAAVPTSNSALLSWTETGTATLYNIEYGASGFTQGTGTVLSGVSNSYNLTTLAPTTAYSYYVQAACGGAAGTSTWSGPFSFTTLVAPPANDNCTDAITVTCGSATTGTTANSTNENMTVCGISGVTTQNTPGVWYKYVGDGSDVTVTTCSSTITSGDSRIAVYSGSCGSLTCIGGNDDAQTAGCSTNTLSSIVTFSTVSGTDYYILVYAYTSTALSFELNVSCTAACSPATGNDECSTAQQVTIGTPITGTNNSCSSASLGVAYPSCGNQFGTYYDTWYWFDSGSVTDVTISLTNQTGTNGFALYSGSCGALTQVTGSCTTTGAATNLTGLTPATYYLRVYSTSPGTRGSYDLTVSNSLGTGSFDNGSFTYYPNPVKNTLNLSYNQEISNVEVFNMLGQKVIANTIDANEAHIDMSNLSKGAYMVKVTSDSQVKTIKVIKE